MNTRIKMLREALDLSQRAFADRIGISGPSVARIESGENNPSKQTIELICSKFNVNPEWLKDGADVPMFLEFDSIDDLVLREMEGEDDDLKDIFRSLVRLKQANPVLFPEYMRMFKSFCAIMKEENEKADR